jgi:hypothetical protein
MAALADLFGDEIVLLAFGVKGAKYGDRRWVARIDLPI